MIRVDDWGFPRFSPVGERALLVTLDDALLPEANQQVHALDRLMEGSPLPGVVEWTPAYVSLLVVYHPEQVQFDAVQSWVKRLLTDLDMIDDQPAHQVEILVRYGGLDGPDLPFVAETLGLSPAQVVEKHTGGVYRVGMMGFMPGFAYLLGLDPALAVPRLPTPRTHVPAGSVGIAGAQTGIYPLDSPGGWRLIGRTEQVLFDPLHAPYFTLSPGDAVRFIPSQDSPLP